MTRDGIGDYLNGIGKFPIMTKAEEQAKGREMARGRSARAALNNPGYFDLCPRSTAVQEAERRRLGQIERRGLRVRKEFIERNLKLVVNKAKAYTWSGLPLDDLVQQGNEGLIIAADLFDYRKGWKFSTYAINWIRQKISRHVEANTRGVHLPCNADTTMRNCRELQEEALSRGETLTLRELAKILDIDLKWLRDIMQWRDGLRSLDAPVAYVENNKPLHDVVREFEDPDFITRLNKEELATTVRMYLNQLPEEERRFLELRFGLEGDPTVVCGHFNRNTMVTRSMPQVAALMFGTPDLNSRHAGRNMKQIERSARDQMFDLVTTSDRALLR